MRLLLLTSCVVVLVFMQALLEHIELDDAHRALDAEHELVTHVGKVVQVL